MKKKLKHLTVLLIVAGIFAACNAHAVVEPEENDMQTRNPDEIIMCAEHNGALDYTVGLTLKPQADKSYLATEDPKIKALISKYGVEFRQTVEDIKYPDLLPYYTLTITGSCIICDEREETKEMRKNIINDFLATGKFEDHVKEYEFVHGAQQ